MKPPESDLLTFIDLLDLDEEVIDRRLMPLMVRKTFSTKHLSSAKYLIKYKLLINDQEGTECDNNDERLYDQFMVNLLAELDDKNIDNICEITNLLLNMFPSNLASKSEHLLQQILTNELCIDTTRKESIEKETNYKILLTLKVCDSILNAVIKSGLKISLPFLETPVEKILDLCSDRLKNHFLMTSVPLLFEGLVGYNILDHIWNYCQKLNSEQNYAALKVLSCLSGYYLPVADKNGQMNFESDLIFQTKFWKIILLGMSSSDSSNRKLSLYLAKRSIDCIVTMKRSIIVSNETGNMLFSWDTNKETEYKSIWDSYFVLMESLEEKQSNIVLPSLQLFEVVKKIGREWLNCAFAIGLKHDNAQVKQKCIEYRIETKIQTEPEAEMLLEALNDINLFDKQEDIESNLKLLKLLCSDINNFLNMLKNIPLVNWSPVPLYYLGLLIGKMIIIDKKLLPLKIGSSKLSSILCDILKTPCNNVIIRRAAQRNFISFFVLHCKDIAAKDLFTILSSLQIDIFNSDMQVKEMKYSLSSYVNDYVTENKLFYELIITSYTNIELILEYIQKRQCINEYYAEIKAKIAKVDSVASRQYSKKSECKNEFVYLTSLYGDIKHILKIHGHISEIPGIIYEIIKKEIKPLFQYTISLLLDDSILNDDMNLYVQSCNNLFYYAGSHPFDDKNFYHPNCNGVIYSEFGDEDVQEIILQINSMCLAILNNNRGDLQSKVFAQNILKMLLCNNVLNTNNCKEIIKMTNFLKMVNGIGNQKEKENKGRLQNKFYETSCVILDALTRNKEEVYPNISEILSFIDKVIECGGYGCLKYILKVMKKMLPVIDENNIKYDITQFIHRMWRETEELKSNSQYAVCIEEFIDLITHDFLLKTSKYNNLILHYSKSIIEYGSVSITPLIFLVQSIGKKDITSELGQIVYILQEILLFAPVPRKDQRILENTLQNIEKEIEEFKKVHFKDLTKDDSGIHHCFSYTVQHLAVATLLTIKDPEIFKTIVDLMMKRIDELFKNKQRYHANSHHHRVLLSALQHMLFILLLQPKSVDLKKTTEWCLELLAKLPHQPTVRMCLEWYIALYYCGKEPNLKKETLENKKFTNLPLSSQLVILYHVMKYRLSEGCNRGEFEFVLDFLLSHTMGPMFSIRLHAQYLATQLYSKGENTIKSKYHLIMDIIQQNFEACSQEKNYIKLKEDFYINTFNVSSCLVPFCIYYFLPCLYEYSSNASELLPTTEECVKYIEENSCYITANYPACYEKSWKLDYLDKVKHAKSEVNEMLESSGTIQKKYIPWRNMSDIDVYESSKKQENRSDLIVVASLIDKLPNLGGMARTSEVFGVKTYVVDSLRHLQDKQFQGLSVSAERWVDIEEVRPGKPLKDYLMTKKAEGYATVAAEQTSNSVPLQGFKFPKKTLLLLGHEKEGVPCDLLPLMDSCVEIPQQGFVRSLNVHVTAAIFVWEYSRQHIL